MNKTLLDSLLERQSRGHNVVDAVGDLILEWIERSLDPFVFYIVNQVMGKYVLELEIKSNARFSEFCEVSKKLGKRSQIG